MPGKMAKQSPEDIGKGLISAAFSQWWLQEPWGLDGEVESHFCPLTSFRDFDVSKIIYVEE